jgi:hypothetical protein
MSDKIQLIVFPLITLGLMVAGVFIWWATNHLLPLLYQFF